MMRTPPAQCDHCGQPVTFPAVLLSCNADEFLCNDCFNVRTSHEP